MWQVTASGTEGSTYVYEVDAPDYAPEGAVFESACNQHGQERKSRGIRETLDIRQGSYGVRLLYPQGKRDELDKLIEAAAKGGIRLTPEDIDWENGVAVIDETDAREWVDQMARE